MLEVLVKLSEKEPILFHVCVCVKEYIVPYNLLDGLNLVSPTHVITAAMNRKLYRQVS